MKNRQGNEIRKWMLDQVPRLTGAEISREAGVNKSLVAKTIEGKRNNRKVLRSLMGQGCPAAFLDLPEDIKDESDIKEAA